jgi:hypothetical protein
MRDTATRVVEIGDDAKITTKISFSELLALDSGP